MNYLGVITDSDRFFGETAEQMYLRHALGIRLERYRKEGWKLNFCAPGTVEIKSPDNVLGTVSFNQEDDASLLSALDRFEWDRLAGLNKRQKVAEKWNTVVHRKGNMVAFDIAAFKAARKRGEL